MVVSAAVTIGAVVFNEVGFYQLFSVKKCSYCELFRVSSMFFVSLVVNKIEN